MSNSSVIKAAKRFEQDPDLPLVAEAKEGDMQAFQQLYDRHHRRIYALCWRMLADKDSAEDVCQEVFVFSCGIKLEIFAERVNFLLGYIVWQPMLF